MTLWPLSSGRSFLSSRFGSVTLWPHSNLRRHRAGIALFRTSRLSHLCSVPELRRISSGRRMVTILSTHQLSASVSSARPLMHSRPPITHSVSPSLHSPLTTSDTQESSPVLCFGSSPYLDPYELQAYLKTPFLPPHQRRQTDRQEPCRPDQGNAPSRDNPVLGNRLPAGMEALHLTSEPEPLRPGSTSLRVGVQPRL